MSASLKASITDRGSEPAYPVSSSVQCSNGRYGLTIREHLAGQTMQGLLANPGLVKPTAEKPAPMEDSYANMAVGVADALLRELEKGAGA